MKDQGLRMRIATRPILAIAISLSLPPLVLAQSPRNVVLIYADDLGYGDVSAMGQPRSTRRTSIGSRRKGCVSPMRTPRPATCTPSRYALLTGEYAFRKQGTGVLPGDAALIIEPGRTTLASILQKAGYTTGVVGKWHSGWARRRA